MANTSKRGFASMDAAKQREIASKGGKAAHAKGTAHEFTSDEARVAGRKGGEAVSRDRAHMSAIGREGGHSRGARARASSSQSSGNTSSDFTRNAGQSFERQVTSERSGLEAGRTGSTSGQQQRSSEQSAYAASDRGGSSSRSDRERNERERSSSDSPSNHGPFSGRDEI